MTTPAPYIESTDSSATIMRGVAAALRGQWMEPQDWPDSMRRLALPGNRLPPAVRQRAVRYAVRDLGTNPAWADSVTAAGLAQWAVGHYDESQQPDERCEAIVIGAPNGGAGHLAALLRAPMLTEHFVTRYRYRGDPDDIAAYHAFGAPLADKILARNPGLAVVNHYDPIHDRFLLPYVNYIRMKLLDLPEAYASFIRRRLRPGGTLLFIDCQYPWGQYRVNRRHYFQVGGLGGIPDADYVNGSSQTEHFLAERGHPGQRSWNLPYPWLKSVESEWGTLPPFQAAVEEFAAAYGFRVRVLHGAHPSDFSRIGFYASYQAALNARQEPVGVLVDCFTQTSPTAALQCGLLPLWLPYNCTDSLALLQQMAPSFPRKRPILLAPVPSFSPAWDITTAQDWVNACGADADITWIGTDPSAYPVDLAALFRFVPALQAWCSTRPPAQRPEFTVADLEALLASIAAQAAAEDEAGRNLAETAPDTR